MDSLNEQLPILGCQSSSSLCLPAVSSWKSFCISTGKFVQNTMRMENWSRRWSLLCALSCSSLYNVLKKPIGMLFEMIWWARAVFDCTLLCRTHSNIPMNIYVARHCVSFRKSQRTASYWNLLYQHAALASNTDIRMCAKMQSLPFSPSIENLSIWFPMPPSLWARSLPLKLILRANATHLHSWPIAIFARLLNGF